MLTRNGVCYNLPHSPYKLKKGLVTLFFSSNLHLNKFEDAIIEFSEAFEKRFIADFKTDINAPILVLVLLYTKIEGRGFYIEIDGEAFTCLNDMVFSGRIYRKKN